MQPGGLAPDVLRHHPDLIGGDVQPVAARVLQEQVVALGAGHGPADHPDVAAHPVHRMHGQVAGGELHGHRVGPPPR